MGSKKVVEKNCKNKFNRFKKNIKFFKNTLDIEGFYTLV